MYSNKAAKTINQRMNTITATSRFEHLPFTISPVENLIVVTAKGSLHFDDLISHVPEFMAHPDFRSGMNLIYDFTNVDSVDGDLTVLMESVESLDDENFISQLKYYNP